MYDVKENREDQVHLSMLFAGLDDVCKTFLIPALEMYEKKEEGETKEEVKKAIEKVLTMALRIQYSIGQDKYEEEYCTMIMGYIDLLDCWVVVFYEADLVSEGEEE